MEPREIALAMVRELEHRAHQRGRGSIKALTAHLGVGRTYFAELRRRNGSLTVERLFSALQFLNVGWQDFFRSVLGTGEDPLAEYQWGLDPTVDKAVSKTLRKGVSRRPNEDD